MSAATGTPKKVWSEAELQAIAEDGYIHEVVDGQLVMSPKNNWYHGRICSRLLIALGEFVVKNKLGALLDSSTGFWMHNHNCRAPDISFVRKGRLVELGFKPRDKRFFPAGPDLAVEILSPNNTRQEIDARLRDFFGSGTQLAWIIDPETESVEICRSLAQRKLLGSGGMLEGEELLPGFQYPIASLFKDWEWE